MFESGKKRCLKSPIDAWLNRRRNSRATSHGGHEVSGLSMEVLPLTACCWFCLDSASNSPVQKSRIRVPPPPGCLGCQEIASPLWVI